MLRELIYENRSYRSFDESMPVPKEKILNWIDNARLAPSASNRQPLKYKVLDQKGAEKVLPLTRWAAALPDFQLPPEGHHPTAFVVICHDTSVFPDSSASKVDLGIAAMTLLLSAVEDGYVGCCIGSFDAERVGEVLRIPERMEPVLMIALGAPSPDETIILAEAKKDGDTTYYRDKHNLHFVPKRKLEDIIIE
ncbi:MAG: nitroreductase family protein [Clostridia bacterium]|nr:nitroreductase family protein [Clostridia bacterium]